MSREVRRWLFPVALVPAVPQVESWAETFVTGLPLSLGACFPVAVALFVYAPLVAALPHDGRRFDEVNWGGLLFASRGVVYDETGEIAKLCGTQSKEWLERMHDTDVPRGNSSFDGGVSELGGRDYFTVFGC